MKEIIFEFYPQLAIIAILSFSMLKGMLFDGSTREIVFTTTRKLQMIVYVVFQIWLVIQGGWFNYIGGAQIIWFILYGVIILLSGMIILSGKFDNKKLNHTVSNNWGSTILILGLYYWGGFFDGLIQAIKNL